MKRVPEKDYAWFSENLHLSEGTKGYFHFKCPYCSSHKSGQKGYVHFGKGWTGCYRDSSHNRPILSFIKDFEKEDFKTTYSALPRKSLNQIHLQKFKKVQDFKPIPMPFGYNNILVDAPMGEEARKYIENRGFSVAELSALGWGYCNQNPYLDPTKVHNKVYNKAHTKDYYKAVMRNSFMGFLIIPFLVNGRAVYYVARDFTGKQKKQYRHKNAPSNLVEVGKSEFFYNQDAIYTTPKNKALVVVEGISDAQTIGKQGVACSGLTLSETQMRLLAQSNSKFIIFCDDKGEIEKTKAKAIQFLDYCHAHNIRKRVMLIDLSRHQGEGKDINEIGRDIINILGKDSPIYTHSSQITQSIIQENLAFFV